MKVVFLDFDGVIATPKSHYKLDPIGMGLVKRICDETGAMIVVSSTWRSSDVKSTVDKITDTNNHRVPIPFVSPEKITGVTEHIFSRVSRNDDSYVRTPRGVEIQLYLDEHPDIDNYVILDDDKDMLLTQYRNFVHTDWRIGITEKDVIKAINILNNKDMNFGEAIKALKKGNAIQREGWNGKGQFVYYIPAAKYPAMTDIAKKIMDEDGMVSYNAYLALKTVQGNISTWVPSITDLFAEDWIIAELN